MASISRGQTAANTGAANTASTNTPPASTAPTNTAPNQPADRRWLRHGASTALIAGALGAIAWWGHRNEWTLPKFSTLIGRSSSVADDWCVQHGVPESQCIECNRLLAPRPPDFGWCKVHGVAQCPLEHPEVAQLKSTPAITPEELERVRLALALRPRIENNSLCRLHEQRIQFASIAAMEKAGVDIAVVTQRPLIEAIVANGEVLYDQTRTAQLSSRVAGTVWRVFKQVGDRVNEGEVLALIDAADVGRAKAEFLQAISQLRLRTLTVERLKPLAEDGDVAKRSLREAEGARQEAQIRLLGAQQALVNLGLPLAAEDFDGLQTDAIADRIQFLGVPAELIAGADKRSTTSNLFPLRSPLDGLVVTRKIVPGEVVDTGAVVLGVADVRRMWLVLDVRQDDARYLALGQRVLFRPGDSNQEPEVSGTVAWISTEVDDQTRTIKARVDLPNVDGRLRANTFGAARIVLRDDAKAIVVPSQAVHRDGDCNIVFVRDKDFLREGAARFFHVRKVRTGVQEGDQTEIIVGLLPGEVIASRNSVVLESQLLKSNLGAGCGCVDGK